LPHVAAGATHQVTVTAEGLSQWNSSVTVEPGQEETLSDIKLRILTVQRTMTVNYSAKEVAAQQLNSEEQQRAF
jgi:cytochrome c biogenesis factor